MSALIVALCLFVRPPDSIEARLDRIERKLDALEKILSRMEADRRPRIKLCTDHGKPIQYYGWACRECYSENHLDTIPAGD